MSNDVRPGVTIPKLSMLLAVAVSVPWWIGLYHILRWWLR